MPLLKQHKVSPFRYWPRYFTVLSTFEIVVSLKSGSMEVLAVICNEMLMNGE